MRHANETYSKIENFEFVLEGKVDKYLKNCLSLQYSKFLRNLTIIYSAEIKTYNVVQLNYCTNSIFHLKTSLHWCNKQSKC